MPVGRTPSRRIEVLRTGQECATPKPEWPADGKAGHSAWEGPLFFPHVRASRKTKKRPSRAHSLLHGGESRIACACASALLPTPWCRGRTLDGGLPLRVRRPHFIRPHESRSSLWTKASLFHGGESGIRTHGGLLPGGFQDRCLRPLSHLSVCEGLLG